MEIGAAEAARRMGVSLRRVEALCKAGHLSGRIVGGRLLIDESALRRSRPVSRPMSPKMAWALIELMSGERPEVSPSERSRLRQMFDRLRSDDDPANLLRSWLRRRAERRAYSSAAADLADLAADPRVVVSGISDPRSGMSAGHEFEGYVDQSDLAGVVSEYLLSQVGKPNVWLHLHALGRRDAPLGLVLADLADHGGPRESSRVRQLLRDSG